MLTRGRRRSGISSLIGAIFFVLVVFLVFSSTVLIFETFTNYAGTFKQVNSQDLQNKGTDLAVQNLAFGGLIAGTANESLPSVANTQSSAYLPIQNMNFTNSMDGWTFSRGYQLSLHNGQVTNYPKNVLPGLDVFTMYITNLDGTNPPYTDGTVITGVTLIVNSAWKVPGTAPNYVPQEPPNSNWAVSVSGNTITWTANNVAPSCANGIESSPATPLEFNWLAVVPPVDGTYLHDITLTWETLTSISNQCLPGKDQGTATITTNVVPSNQGGTDTEEIGSVLGIIPGGAYGGYDGTSTNIGSESGPGSLYMSFQPTLNGVPLTTTTQGSLVVPEQLTTEMNFTTYFNLDSQLALATESNCGTASPVDCPVLSLGYSLDHAISGEPPLITMNAYLTDVSAGLGHTKQIINSTTINLTNNGWFMNDTAFSLGVGSLESAANTLPAGQYELVISLSATMFGATPPSANYPASLLMHFDDIGLSLRETSTGTSYCVDTAATGSKPCAPTSYAIASGDQACPSTPKSCGLYTNLGSLIPSDLQSLTFTAQLSISSPGAEVTAYAYLENIQASPAKADWIELGQSTFTSSTNIDVTIPASIASSYLDEYGGFCSNLNGQDSAGSSCIRIYAVSAQSFGTLAINVTMVAQTWEQQKSTLFVMNNGTSPVHIVSIYVSNQTGIVGNNELGTFASGTSTSASTTGASTVLTDANSPVWSNNEWAGYYLYMTTGPAAGQSLLIVSNTAHSITTAPFTPAPTSGGGDAFQINGGGLWVSGGQDLVVPLGAPTEISSSPTAVWSLTQLPTFAWTTGQTYVVTITTDKGLVFTQTFVAP